MPRDDQDQSLTRASAACQNQQTEKKAEVDLLQGLDLANLDLKVEAIDERISPSETNVFDK